MPDPFFTTRNRSFSQSSLRKKLIRSSSQHASQKQLLKNSTMASFMPKLQRLVQQGKIQQFLNSDKHSKAKLLYSTHINDMQKQLADSKKSLSSMILKAKSRELVINKLKSELSRIQTQKQMLKAKSSDVNKLFQNALSSLDNKKGAKQNTEWIQKSYIHVKQRLVKDEYFHKIQYEKRHQYLENEKARVGYLEKKANEINLMKKQLQKAVSEAKKITSQQTNMKNQLIDIINQDLQEKEILNQLRLQKQKKQSDINQLSTWIIQKQELSKYLNIMYTHRILSQIIRVKNTNLIKKYSQVQSAYLHIKSNTNIVEFQKILKKMQEQDLIYDKTVKKVSDLQEQLQKMQARIQKAKRQRNEILSQQGKIQKYTKDYYQGMEKDRYDLMVSQKKKAEHRINQDDILKKRVEQWGYNLAQKVSIFRSEGMAFQQILAGCVSKLMQKSKAKK